jgi:tol-pal system protein YbgF
LLLLFCLIFLSADEGQSKKAYELMYEDIQTLKLQVKELAALLQKNSAELEEIKDRVKILGDLIRRSQAEQGALKEDFKNIPVQFQLLNSKLEEIQFQNAALNEILVAIQNLTPAAKPGEAAAKTGKAAPGKTESTPAETQKTAVLNIPAQEMYNSAYGDYLKGNYSLAIDSFKLFLERYPSTTLSDNALYWIGECYYSEGRYKEAIEAFDELLLTYSSGDKAPAAYLKKGMSLMQQGKKEEALTTFRILISKYPMQEEARLAQQKIDELGGK